MTTTAGNRGRVRRWLLAVLAAELMIGVYLFGSDFARSLPGLAWPSAAPQLTQPVSPGDQTRRYRRDTGPASPAAPGRVPRPANRDMPDRLRIEPGGEATLRLTGAIAPGDADRVAEALNGAETAPLRVILDSPGGSVQDALNIGRQLREGGVDTEIQEDGICLSACPYMLAGGADRSVAEGAWVGVHQHYFGENIALPAFLAVEDIQRGQGEVMAYLLEMGIDPALMSHALVTPPDEIYLLMPEELQRYRLVSPEDGTARR